MIAELKVENNHLPMETYIFQLLLALETTSRVILALGGKDTCTLRAEDWNHSVAFNLILALGL
jgi:hypothetical protein